MTYLKICHLAKLFADNTSIISVVEDTKHSTDQLNRKLDLISKCVYQWEMLNPEPKKKQAQFLTSYQWYNYHFRNI